MLIVFLYIIVFNNHNFQLLIVTTRGELCDTNGSQVLEWGIKGDTRKGLEETFLQRIRLGFPYFVFFLKKSRSFMDLTLFVG